MLAACGGSCSTGATPGLSGVAGVKAGLLRGVAPPGIIVGRCSSAVKLIAGCPAGVCTGKACCSATLVKPAKSVLTGCCGVVLLSGVGCGAGELLFRLLLLPTICQEYGSTGADRAGWTAGPVIGLGDITGFAIIIARGLTDPPDEVLIKYGMGIGADICLLTRRCRNTLSPPSVGNIIDIERLRIEPMTSTSVSNITPTNWRSSINTHTCRHVKARWSTREISNNINFFITAGRHS
jgi:hypothetical protein